MAGELFKARRTFVDSVSKVMIKQLLDDLRLEKVLNNEEADSVTEENSSRADQARCLIDMVLKKGDKASGKMIACLGNRNSGLSELGLSPGQLDQTTPSSFPQLSEQEQGPQDSSGLLLTNAQFKADVVHRMAHKIYPMMDKSVRRRLALLITNVEFDVRRMRRCGAEKDEENMEKLLRALGYEVVKHRDLSGREMDEAVKVFSKREEHSKSDSVFVVIMSHGKLGSILGVHWKQDNPDEFPINNIFKYLNTENCKALLNKPKVILIQACRGEKDGSVLVDGSTVVSDSVLEPCPELGLEDDSIREHIEKDFISLLSCTPDTVSYRHSERGSFFIQYIVEAFQRYACEEHVEDLFMKVMGRFEENFSTQKRQMPTKDRASLTKHFYLFPGL